MTQEWPVTSLTPFFTDLEFKRGHNPLFFHHRGCILDARNCVAAVQFLASRMHPRWRKKRIASSFEFKICKKWCQRSNKPSCVTTYTKLFPWFHDLKSSKATKVKEKCPALQSVLIQAVIYFLFAKVMRCPHFLQSVVAMEGYSSCSIYFFSAEVLMFRSGFPQFLHQGLCENIFLRTHPKHRDFPLFRDNLCNFTISNEAFRRSSTPLWTPPH